MSRSSRGDVMQQVDLSDPWLRLGAAVLARAIDDIRRSMDDAAQDALRWIDSPAAAIACDALGLRIEMVRARAHRLWAERLERRAVGGDIP